MKDLNSMSHTEAREAVASLFINANALVVDLADAIGYPDMMVLVKDCMPLFIFCKPNSGGPQQLADADWAAAKATVVKNLADVNATWFDIDVLSDLDWILGEVLHRTKPGEIRKEPVQLTAEQQGFEFDTPEQAQNGASGAADGSGGMQTPKAPQQPQRDRKAWLA